MRGGTASSCKRYMPLEIVELYVIAKMAISKKDTIATAIYFHKFVAFSVIIFTNLS